MNIEALISQYQVRLVAGATTSGTTVIDFPVIDLLSSRPLAPSTFGPIRPDDAPQSQTANDIGPYENYDEGSSEVAFVVNLGTVADGAIPKLELYRVDDTNGTNPVLISATKPGEASVSPAAAAASVSADTRCLVLDLVRTPSRYVRAKLTRTGAAVSVLSANAIVGAARRAPTQKHPTTWAQKLALGN